MTFCGKRIFPIITFVFLFSFFAPLWASEAIFYSMPEEKANANLNKRLQWETPNRQILYLNGAWVLKSADGGQSLGEVNIPCTFQIENRLIFEKSFRLIKRPEEQYLLNLGEMNGKVRLFLNDSLIYKNTLNYLPITLSLSPDLLLDGNNTLQLHIKSENRRFGDAPAFYPINLPRVDTGILSGIYLEVRSGFYFDTINVNTGFNGTKASVSGKITLNRFIPPAAEYTVQVAYMSSQGMQQVANFPVRQESFKEIDLPAWPDEEMALWTPENPVRYWIEATLDSAGREIDKVRRPLVMRTIKTDAESVWLNGEKIKINGINYIYQNKEGSQLFDPDLVKKDLEVIKKQGINAVRVVLHPLPEQFYALCDEIGLLCLQDLPLIYWELANSSNQISAHWMDYIEHAVNLTQRYNSIAGIGAAYYLNGAAANQRIRLAAVNKLLRNTSVPVYASTLFPEPGIANITDFQIVEILQRNRLENNLKDVDEALSGILYFPSTYAKAINYRVDSTTITHDLQQIHEFYEKLTQHALQTEVEGHFIPVYNDFYLHLPSLQNGLESDFSYNQIGIVELNRQSRGISLSGEDSSNTQSDYFGIIHEGKSSHSFLYIIIGFLNIFVFLITYRRYRIFRQNLGYSIQKPHGFFVSLSERIIIPYKQSFFLMLVISVNGAIIFSSVAYFYRNHLIFDYILSLFFYTPALKSFVTKMIWDQVQFLVVMTLVIIAVFYTFAFVIKISSFIGRRRVLFNQALAVSIWAASPFVILLPLGILMYNLLLMMKSYWIIWGVLLYFHAWFYFRWINGIRVLTDRLYSRVFLVFTFILIAVAATLFYFYEDRYQVMAHFEFLYRLYEYN